LVNLPLRHFTMKILYNARIYTLDGSRPIASAIAMERERILAVGETDDLLPEFEQAEKQDMAGQTILPGLTDAHLHLQHYALSLQKINCETDTLEECLHRVKERVRSSQPGEWILGHGWNQNNWSPSSPTGVLPPSGRCAKGLGLRAGLPLPILTEFHRTTPFT
jgi:predicted amidohydrolase YtcJ